MSMSRQQRRAMERRLAKSGDVADAISKLDQNAERFGKEAYEDWKRKELPQVQAETCGMMYLLVLAYARIKRGYGAKRLRDLAYEFNEFCDDMTLEKTTNSELIDLLDSEIKGLDTRKMLEDVQRWGDKKMRERAGETAGRKVS